MAHRYSAGRSKKQKAGKPHYDAKGNLKRGKKKNRKSR